jgi:hypothetical protein
MNSVVVHVFLPDKVFFTLCVFTLYCLSAGTLPHQHGVVGDVASILVVMFAVAPVTD